MMYTHSSTLLVTFSLLLCVQFSISARILIVLPTPSLSHHLFYQPIIKELALRGHEIVSVTPHPLNDEKLTNLTEINIHEETYGVFSAAAWLLESQTKPESQMTKIRKFIPVTGEMLERILSSPKVNQLITDSHNQHFDLVIVEMLGYANFFAFKELYNCPAVGLVSLDASIDGMDAVGNPPDPNYYASALEANAGPNLSFWQRLELLWHTIDYRIYYYYEIQSLLDKISKKYFKMDKSTIEFQNSVDLILANTNPVFHIARPHVPAFIEIGGLHQRDRKPLPQDLQSYMDKSSKGVVYFSLGSNVQSANLPENIRTSIIEAFEKLPYNVIWKFENITLPNKPKNVLIKQWLPQQDVLDHPNLKAFVTQGGLQSLEEAIKSRVPMIGIPFGADQEFNVNRIVTLGIGKKVQFKEISTELLVKSITEVASNPKYKENVQKVASQIWDQQTKPLDRAIWWIEYVIRHKGAKHLRCPAADLPWYKYLLLDIIGFVLGVLIFVSTIVIYLIKIVLKYIFSGKSKYKQE